MEQISTPQVMPTVTAKPNKSLITMTILLTILMITSVIVTVLITLDKQRQIDDLNKQIQTLLSLNSISTSSVNSSSLSSSNSSITSSQSSSLASLEYTKYDGKYISFEYPKGWQVTVADESSQPAKDIMGNDFKGAFSIELKNNTQSISMSIHGGIGNEETYTYNLSKPNKINDIWTDYSTLKSYEKEYTFSSGLTFKAIPNSNYGLLYFSNDPVSSNIYSQNNKATFNFLSEKNKILAMYKDKSGIYYGNNLNMIGEMSFLGNNSNSSSNLNVKGDIELISNVLSQFFKTVKKK